MWEEIKSKVSTFQEEIREKVKNLERVNIEEKKVEERTKIIVKENLGNYVNHVKKLSEEVKNCGEKRLEEFREIVPEIFSDFNKKTFKSYQKSIFLAGSEVVVVRRCVGDFFSHLDKIFKKYKWENMEVANLVATKLKNMRKIEEGRKEAEEKIKNLEKKEERLEREELKLDEDVERIKKSKNYLANLKRKEKKMEEEENIHERISELRELIDFKVLGNVFHANEKEMGLIKIYRENFRTAFQEDDKGILDLLEGAKLNNEKILDKFNEIEVKKEDIKSLEVFKDETKGVLKEKEKLRLKKKI